MKRRNVVMVVDAQGGGLGKQLIQCIRKEMPEVHIIAVGTNTTSTNTMLKAGAHEAASGENSMKVAGKKADVIIGPIGMVIADAMLGEITPEIAKTIAQADVRRIMIPFTSCDNYIAGVSDFSLGRLIEDAIGHLKKYLTEEM